MADQFAGPSMKTPAISTPLLPMSPLPSMDVLMHSPGLLYSSPGQDGKASNDDAPPVQKALPREVTLSKLDQAEKLVSDVRQGAQDLIAALRETAKLTSAPAGAISEEPPVSRPKRALSSSDEGTAAKRSRIASAGGDKQLDQADVSTEDDAEVTPVSLVISKVEAALAELAGLGKELTEAGVSFLPSSVRGAKAEPDGEFAVREWDALVAERKAKCEMDNVQAALRKVHSQLRQRFEDDRETVSEIDKVMKGLSAADPDKVSGALQLLRENGVLEGGELSEGGSVIEKLERVQKAAGWMEMELVAESEKVLWHSSGGGSAVGGSAEGEDKGGVLEDRPACLRCLLPGVLRATVGVSKEGQPTTVSVTDTNQVPSRHNGAGHNVFSDVTSIATSAVFHFKAQRPGSALERFLVWLASYRSLFTQRCSVCGRVLSHDPRCDALLPPAMRPFKAIVANDAREREALHSFCHLQRLAYF